MLALRALLVPVVCALCLQRVLPNIRLSLEVKPSATGANSHHPVSVPALPTASRMMAENRAGNDSAGSDRKISRCGMPKCFGA